MGNRTSGRGKDGNSVVGHLGEVRRDSGGLGGEERRPVDRCLRNAKGCSAGGLEYGDEGSLGDRRRGLEISRGIWGRRRRFQES